MPNGLMTDNTGFHADKDNHLTKIHICLILTSIICTCSYRVYSVEVSHCYYEFLSYLKYEPPL